MDDVYFRDVQKNITQATFYDIYTRLTMLAQSVFEWSGLPEGIDQKFIERYLFFAGRCMFFKDAKLGWMVTGCTDAGMLNYYDEPVRLYPFATNYIPEEGSSSESDDMGYENGTECVLIMNNDLSKPTSQTIQLYAARLTEIQRTMDLNIAAQKTPFIIKCNSDKQLLSLKNLYRDVKGFESVCFLDKSLEVEDSVKVLNTAAPIVFDTLALEKNRMWNECMTFLGINNANMDKRERLVDDEVQANNEQIMLAAEMMLKARERAAEAMSKLSGLNISVKLRQLQKPILGLSTAQEGRGGVTG